MILWGEEEQRNERAFHACVETSDMELVTTRKEDGPNLTVDPATIDEIVVFTSKKGDDYE